MKKKSRAGAAKKLAGSSALLTTIRKAMSYHNELIFYVFVNLAIIKIVKPLKELGIFFVQVFVNISFINMVKPLSVTFFKGFCRQCAGTGRLGFTIQEAEIPQSGNLY